MKLTQQKAEHIIAEAYKMVGIHYKVKYRLGQAIMNELPFELYREMSQTVYDLFYLTDNDKVLKIFLEHYVEE